MAEREDKDWRRGKDRDEVKEKRKEQMEQEENVQRDREATAEGLSLAQRVSVAPGGLQLAT